MINTSRYLEKMPRITWQFWIKSLHAFFAGLDCSYCRMPGEHLGWKESCCFICSRDELMIILDISKKSRVHVGTSLIVVQYYDSTGKVNKVAGYHTSIGVLPITYFRHRCQGLWSPRRL